MVKYKNYYIIRYNMKVETRKSTRSKGIENDASKSNLTFDLLTPKMTVSCACPTDHLC